MIGLKANFGKSVDLAGGDGKVMKDFSFIASFVPIVEKWTFRVLAIDELSQCATPSVSIQEIGKLCLRDVISFKVFHNALGLLLFSDIRFE